MAAERRAPGFLRWGVAWGLSFLSLSLSPAAGGDDFFISPAAARAAFLKNSDWLMIDVRPAGEFALCRVPGSINLPLSALEGAALPKGRPLVLAARNVSSTALEGACRRFRAAGRKVHILRGGLALWRARGFPLEGDSPGKARLDRVSPEDYLRERDAGRWRLADGPRQAPAAAKDLPLLFANEDGDYAALASTAPDDALYLEGGWRALRAFQSAKPMLLDPNQGDACGAEDVCSDAGHESCSSCR